MTLVHTDLGPGRIVESKTVHGRTEYRVAGDYFEQWFDATKLGFAPVDEDNSVDLPYNPDPQYGVGPLTDATIQPIHEIDPDERLHPADSLSFEDRSRDEGERRGEPGPNPDLFARSAGWQHDPEGLHDPDRQQGYGGGQPSYSQGLEWNAPERSEYAHPDFRDDDDGLDETGTMNRDWMNGGGGEHPADTLGRELLFDPAVGGDTANYGPQQGRQENYGPGDPRNRQAYRTADTLEGAPTKFAPEFIVNDTDDEYLRNVDVEEDERETTDPEGIVHFAGTQREAILPALMVALPALGEALGAGGAAAGAEGAAGAAGAAGEAGGMGSAMSGAGKAMQVGQGVNAVGDAVQKFDQDGNPLPLPDLGQGWGDLTQKKGNLHEAVDWGHMYEQMGTHPGETEGYPVQDAHQWAHEYDQRPQEDPYEEWGWQRGPKPVVADRRGDYVGGKTFAAHLEDTQFAGLDDRYASISASVDPNDPVAQFRHDPAAFINRMGHVQDEGLNPRIAQVMDLVEADEAFRTAAWKDVRKKAMRLRAEGRVSIKDVDHDRIYASVQGDHGTYDVMIKKGGAFGGFGGGHAITNWHCSCEWGKWAFKRQMTYVGRLCSHGYASYMEMQSKHLTGQPRRKTRYPQVRKASDQTTQDWKIDDTGDAAGALDEIRDWAETPQEDDLGHMQDRVEDIRDAVERAREEGVDADQLVASLRRMAAPGDPDQPGSIEDMMGVPATSTPVSTNPFSGGDFNPSQIPGVAGGPNTDTPAAPDPTGGVMTNQLPGGGATPGGGTTPGAGGTGGGSTRGPNTNSAGGSTFYQDNYGGDGSKATTNDSYTVQPGDTLSGIAESHGGGDYNNITNVGGGDIANKDLIQPGQKLDLSAVGGGGSKGDWSSGSSSSGSGSGSSPKVQGPGLADTSVASGGSSGGVGSSVGSGIGSSGLSDSSSGSSSGAGGSSDGKSWLGKGSSRRVADSPIDPTVNPAAPPGQTNPADPNATPVGGPGRNGTGVAPAGPDTPQTSDTGNAGGADAMAAGGTNPAAGTTDTGTGTSGGFDMSNIGDTMGGISDAIGQGAGMASDIAGGIGSAISSVTGLLGARELHADRDWLAAAYPDGAFGHKPFNGSGGENITAWGQSKDNVKDNYSDNRDDVTKEPKKTHLEDLSSMEHTREHWGDGTNANGGAQVTSGIRRAGHGPTREPVVPEVVREQRISHNRVAEVEAVPDDFDPYSRTAASFDDPYAEQAASAQRMMAAANTNDIVAAFQAQADAGGSAITAATGSGGQYDDFSNSPAFRNAMQRTAGRNYSLAEQAALMREGDIGGAGNSDLLDLQGTHYEAMNSVGLW